MEHKETTAFNTKIDADQGIVETVFAVMGNVDQGLDIIHNGAFTKTFAERGRRVKVLDQHRTDSVLRVVGQPVALRELSKAELPADLLADYPDASGGAWARVQFLMDTPEGEGAFKRIKSGAISEWSFGYDALDFDHSTVKKDGEEITVRNLKTIKLYELSPVLFGMNPATTTLSAKEADEEGDAPDPKARGDGQGQGGDPQGDGGADLCVCPKCGATAPHEKGTPCAEVECPDCGAAMEGKAAKDESLEERLSLIRSGFYEQFERRAEAEIAREGWVRDVFDAYVIVEHSGQLWRVSYEKSEDGLTFVPREEWIEVEVAYIETASIRDRMIEVLAELGLYDEKSGKAPADGNGPPQAADDTSQDASEQAGPDVGDADVPPTSNDRLRQLIAQELVDLAILELD